MAHRGQLTDETNTRMKMYLGREASITELHLMPYVQFTMMNNQKLDVKKINKDEREILSLWRKAGYITGGASKMTMDAGFWEFINMILYDAYVNYDDQH